MDAGSCVASLDGLARRVVHGAVKEGKGLESASLDRLFSKALETSLDQFVDRACTLWVSQLQRQQVWSEACAARPVEAARRTRREEHTQWSLRAAKELGDDVDRLGMQAVGERLAEAAQAAEEAGSTFLEVAMAEARRQSLATHTPGWLLHDDEKDHRPDGEEHEEEDHVASNKRGREDRDDDEPRTKRVKQTEAEPSLAEAMGVFQWSLA
jgi:hypothetical protein